MRLIEFQCKDVINIENGRRVGYVCDIEIDPKCATITALIIEKRSFLSYFRFIKEPNILVIPMENIVSIGADVILVRIFC